MIRVSICGLCKNLYGLNDAKHPYCLAFPDGHPLDFYASTVKECGNGAHFEPKEKYLKLCNEKFYKEFA
jgi:hypothetical protein